MKFILHKTCGACPEQYDVYLEGVQVAYFRLRHGTFRVDMPDAGGETMWSTRDFEGDGVFANDEERDSVLRAALGCVLANLNAMKDDLYEIVEEKPT